MTNEIKKVIRNGKVAVLYSPGYGACWTGWDTDYLQMLYHPDLVEWVENDKQGNIEEIVNSILGTDNDFYLGGAEQLTIKWLDIGTRFKINEFDGNEIIETIDDLIYIA